MEMNFENVNWLAILACVVFGQGFLTVWFVVIFAKPWAKEYGVGDPREHTKAIPGFTYGIGALCVLLLSLGLSVVQSALGVSSLGDGLLFGIVVAVCFSITTAVPGYIFLRRYRALGLAMGAQTVLVVVLSTVLAVWR